MTNGQIVFALSCWVVGIALCGCALAWVVIRLGRWLLHRWDNR